jgi:hypothetical protein
MTLSNQTKPTLPLSPLVPFCFCIFRISLPGNTFMESPTRSQDQAPFDEEDHGIVEGEAVDDDGVDHQVEQEDVVGGDVDQKEDAEVDDLQVNNSIEMDQESLSPPENDTEGGGGILSKRVFDEHALWVVGSWRRVPFNLDSFPQALCAIRDRKRKLGTVCLRDFDEERGNLWQMVPAGDDEKEDGLFYLEVEAVGKEKPRRLSSDELILEEYSAEKDAQFIWKFRKEGSFRGGPLGM